MTLHAIDIFSGAGGLATGVARAGFSTVAVFDNDEISCETLGLNINNYSNGSKEAKIINADIEKTSFLKLEGRVALISGGPPCQPFSNGGRHHAHNDSRDMFPEAIRAVREIKPRAFIFENVAGLRRPSFREYFEYIRLQLCHPEILKEFEESWASHLRRLEDYHLSGDRSGLNYRLIAQSLNAADYGIPQHRNRIFFVGFQESAGVHWHFPQPTHSKQSLISEMESGKYWERNEVPNSRRTNMKGRRYAQTGLDLVDTLPWVTLREALSDLETPYKPSEKNPVDPMHVFRPGAKVYKGHTGCRLDEPAKTIKAGVHGVPGGENMFTNDAGSLRYFTLRECARIQTFPDSYKFGGSWSATMKQLGNAVPVDMAEVVANGIFKVLENSDKGVEN